jgi:hypothetical protein
MWDNVPDRNTKLLLVGEGSEGHPALASEARTYSRNRTPFFDRWVVKPCPEFPSPLKVGYPPERMAGYAAQSE